MLFKKTSAPRKVFGFLCSPQLSNLMRDLSSLLMCPIFTVCEHSLEIGALSIVSACEDVESKEMLISHLQAEHLLKPTLALSNEYDVTAAQQAIRRELARMRLDRLAHELVAKVEKEGVPAKLLVDVTNKLITDARRRRTRSNYVEGRDQEW